MEKNALKSIFLTIFLLSSAEFLQKKIPSTGISDRHKNLSNAIKEVVRSFDTPSAMCIIKVCANEDITDEIADDLTESLAANNDDVKEIYARNYSDVNASRKIRMNAVLIFSSEMTILEIEDFLKLSFHFSSDKKLLIILLNPDIVQSDMKLILDITWNNFITSIHVVTIEINGDVTLHTYFPYTKDFCGQARPVIWNIYRNGKFIMQRDHFPRKDENFFGCPLIVAIFDAAPYMIIHNESETIDVDGVDGNALKTISSKLNFSLNFTIISDDLRWGELYDNNNATGASELVR